MRKLPPSPNRILSLLKILSFTRNALLVDVSWMFPSKVFLGYFNYFFKVGFGVLNFPPSLSKRYFHPRCIHGKQDTNVPPLDFLFLLDIFNVDISRIPTCFAMMHLFKEHISWIWDVNVPPIFLPVMFSPKICINTHGFKSRPEQTKMQNWLTLHWVSACPSTLFSMQTPFLRKNVN